MAFRRDKEKALRWKRWVQNNRDQLQAAGVPAEVYEDRDRWLYFVEHATLSTPQQKHWLSVERLSPAQMKTLCDFLASEYASAPSEPPLLRALRRELGLLQSD